MRIDVPESTWTGFLNATDTFWSGVLAGRPDGEGTVVTEIFGQHVRVALRNLSMANAVRYQTGGQLLLVTGADRRWMQAVWADLDVQRVEEYARANGADVFDIQEAARRLASSREGKLELTVMGATFTADINRLQGERDVDAVVRAAWSRVSKAVPYVEPPTDSVEHDAFRRHARSLAAVWDALLDAVDVQAFVTSHIDYDQWAPAVTGTLRRDRPVIHVQSTGGMKAYAIWPHDVEEHRRIHGGTSQSAAIASNASIGPTFRSVLSPRIGQIFGKLESHPHGRLGALAELTVARNKAHLGRPSWWRSGANATLDLRTSLERQQFRQLAASGLGLDPDRPIVAVFNHAISDAVNTNVEAFEDLSSWFTRTVEHAALRTDVSWLLLDHPSQDLYDDYGYFEELSNEFDEQHMVFRPSNTLTKNAIWSLADVGVTVRGSISNELPAFGIGALQAGWSEWSHCGVSHVADEPATYWESLDRLVGQLRDGQGTATREQMRRARLWQWFYRVGGDVNTTFIPHWAALEGPEMIETLAASLLHAVPDGDPLFEAVGRLWENRDNVLSRFDLTTFGIM